ncbi:hypothetical protein [Streptomyces sp. SP18BB07]|uniref:hypothetical protein n=1 Tax=Streptomyces sp. SP18BB07 TaxID=3002522 RepID=UPI002E780D5B|nr:hypothetical protein [Streptomyces sp. SP18BB07]MEE1764380.1 hypothetical protein [Streptomyces sp. SP18BB07]
MSPTLALVRDTSALEQRIALIACGQRPGKTQPCDSCRRKGAGLLNVAATGAADAVAAAICGTGKGPACHGCKDKAAEIVRAYNEGAE